MSGGALYVFAVVRSGHPLPPAVDGTVAAALRTVEEAGLAAVVGDAPERLRPRRRDLMAHQDVLAALSPGGPVLPMRFGTVADGAGALRQRLCEEREVHERTLERLTGRCEFNVKATAAEHALAAVVRDDPAVRRLRSAARARPGFEADVRLGEAVASALTAAAGRAGEDAVRELTPYAVDVAAGPGVRDCAVNVSFLVGSGSAGAFRARADALAAAHRDRAELRVTGPLPCYSFVGEPAGAGV